MTSRSDCNQVLLWVILGIIIYFCLIQPKLDNMCKSELKNIKQYGTFTLKDKVLKYKNTKQNKKTKEGLANLNDLTTQNTNDNMKLDRNKCSKQCCKHIQWTLPNELKTPDMANEKFKNYQSSNYSCNFGEGSGCLCISKDNINALVSRGANTNNNTCGSAI